MVKLAEINNISKARKLALNGKSFIEVPAFGDGNCMFNSLGLVVIDLIKQDKLKLDAEKQARLMRALQNSVEVLRKRCNDYQSGGNYSDVANDLLRFIEFIEGCKGNFASLVQYIHLNFNDRFQVAALHVALAPALREIGTERYLELLRQKHTNSSDVDYKNLVSSEIEDAEVLKNDHEDAGPETALPVCEFLGITVSLFDDQTKKAAIYINPLTNVLETDEPVNSDAAILKVGAHWNYVYPADQTTGLAAGDVLPVNFVAKAAPEVRQAQEVERVFEETQSLVSQEKEKYRAIKSLTAQMPTDLVEVTTIMKTINQNLIDLDSVSESESVRYLIGQHEKVTSGVVTTMRQHLALTAEKIDAVVGSSGNQSLVDLKKNILLGNDESSTEMVASAMNAAQIVADKNLARALQNEEILSFLSEHYPAISGGSDHQQPRTKNASQVNESENKKPRLK